ncbi:MAG: recombinase family protein [Cyanobacteria bacterium P01_A01_bin.37]
MTTVAYSYSEPLLESPPDPQMWLKMEGDRITHVYQDLGDRLQLHQLLDDCKVSSTSPSGVDASTMSSETSTQRIQNVVLRRLDDLGNTIDEVGDRLQQFYALGITLVSLDSGSEFFTQQDSDSPVDGADAETDPAALLALFQTMHQQQNARRIRLGHARNRVKALPPPGKAPYGYRRGKDRYALDRSTSPVVKDFVEHFLLYGSLRGSVRYVAKKYNKNISVSTGQRWLTSPVYRGDLAYQNGDIVPDTHLAIISRDEAAQVDRLLRRNRKLPARTASAPRSLAGLVKCGICQSPMKITRTTSRGSSKEYLYLTPVDCPYRTKRHSHPMPVSTDENPVPVDVHRAPCQSISYEQVLDATIQHICTDLPKAVSGATLPDLDRIKTGIQQQISAKEEILRQLPTLEASGILDAETADLRIYSIRTEIATLRQKQDQLPPVNLTAIAQTVSIPQFWLDLSEAERRFYFREFIERINIYRSWENDKTSRSHSPEWRLDLTFMF